MAVPALISVVITTYNRSDALLAVLAGLLRQTDRGFEVIVADDGSREDQQHLLLESKVSKELKITHAWMPDEGFTLNRNRNLGAALSNGQYLVFLDGDCVPEKDFIAQHRRLAQEGYFVNGSRVLLSEELSNQIIRGEDFVVGRSLWFWLLKRVTGNANKILGLIRLPDGSYRVKSKFSWKGIRGANLGVWKSDLELVDGFDESFVGWGHDDADFVLRLHNAGLKRKNGFCATEVYHLWHPEAARNSESLNARTVHERIGTGIVRASKGYAQTRHNDDAVVTRLG